MDEIIRMESRRADLDGAGRPGEPSSSPAARGHPSVPPQVALIRCEGYDEGAVYQAVGCGLALLGGPERFARPGESILLKPNLLVASPPERHVTTHPAVFRAVALHLQAAGARLSFGDSPGFGWLKGVAWRAGLLRVAEELGIALADFSSGQMVSFEEGKLIKQFVIAGGALAADGMVSLPKFKTHGLTRLTGAVKNQLGCIPGLLKGEFHARMPDLDRFCQVLVDLNRLLRPRLYVMDGIVAMEGRGPRNGSPRPMSALLLSSDPVALDATACRMMDLNPALVPTNTWGERWGLGRAQPVEILGDPLESFITPDFQVNRRPPSTRGRRGRFSSFMQGWVIPRPVMWSPNCTRCGTCVKVCPVTPKAITFQNGRTAPPSYDYGLCIRCYCCQEMCPEDAIRIQTPPLGRLIHR
jgi:uncharacterized protein (DUF362 family)/Pyruvate/2-oxoacid:ferredoxin oxidoreductase delta subunit